jgi:enoyl-CoA hydratase/carnithine racemase
MSSVSITIRIHDGIARIALDRPPQDVLEVEMLRRLNDAEEGINAFPEKPARVWSHR